MLDIAVFDNWMFAIMITSWFWFLGIPIQLLLSMTLTGYLTYVTLYSLLRTLVYFNDQGEGSDTDGFIKWYLFSSIVNWIFGLSIIYSWMLTLTPYPVFGGLLNWMIYEGLKFNLYKDGDLLTETS